LKNLGENKLGCRLNFTCKKDGSTEGEFDGVWDRPVGLDGAKCIDNSNSCFDGFTSGSEYRSSIGEFGDCFYCK
jgi:hypothetical protein